MLSSGRHSYDLLLARSGQRALEMLHQRRPDAMVLDCGMPGMDGHRVLLEKSRDASIRNIPVVVVTSTDPAADRPIVIENLIVTRSGGLSVRDLLSCVQSISEILSPSV